ncbi:MAG: DUF2877 domain-containing protein [Coriobacteriales bacterium]|nr:DUF2877 domain-containing protein [Coriobacteriales bacterium]
MSEYRAYRIGERLRSLLKGTISHGRIHSVFAHTANIEVDGSLYVFSADKGASVRSVDIRRGLDFLTSSLEAGQPCSLTREGAQLGQIYIDFSHAETWTPKLRLGWRSICSGAAIDTYLGLLQSLHRSAGQHKHIDAEWIRQLGHPDLADEATRKLIGLGPGLTPAGDDIVAGALAAANHLLPRDGLALALGAATAARATKTTDLSRQILEDAIRGDYHEFLDGLVYTLVTDDSEGIAYALRRLLSIGSSSGSDMAAGIATVLSALQETREPRRLHRTWNYRKQDQHRNTGQLPLKAGNPLQNQSEVNVL